MGSDVERRNSLKISVRQTNIFLFALYNFAYVLYRVNTINRLLYMGVLGLFFLFEIYVIIDKGHIRERIFNKQFRETMLVALLFLIISLCIQFFHGNFQIYLVEELLYFIVPCLVAFVSINFNKAKDIKLYFYIILIKLVLYFILRFWGTFSLAAILSISLSDSNSSIYEIVIAHDFLFLMIVFMYFDDFKASVISFVCCILAFKRLPFLLAIIIMGIYVLGKFVGGIQLGSVIKKMINWLNGKFSRYIIFTMFLMMLLLPTIMGWIYSDSGVAWFYDIFSLDLNKVTSGRVNIVNYALNNFSPNGLGSITNFFETNPVEIYRRVANMHCDVIRLKIEVTIIGYAIYSFVLFRIFKESRLTTLLLLYLVGEMVLSHMADNLNIWLMMYLFTAYLNYCNVRNIREQDI